MRIGFDVSQTGRYKAGCGYYAYGLIRALAEIDETNEYILYPAVGDFFWDPDCATETFRTERPNFRRTPAPKSFVESKQFWRNPPPDFEERLGNPDIVHVNNFFCPIGLRRARLVYTLYDLSFMEEPAWTTEANRIGCFHGVFRASLYADVIVAISEFTRRHFLEMFPHYPPERVVVIYPASRFEGPREIPRPARLDFLEPGRFWLNVGTLEPRKNHLCLLEAYARLIASQPDPMPLVLAGAKGWLSEPIERELRRPEFQGRVFWLGYVNDDELRWLYQNCFALVYPSLFEGFGLPVLEAMSLGAPVICSNSTSLAEIATGAALLVDPADPAGLAWAMQQLATDTPDRALLRQRVLDLASRFSWQLSARRLLEVFQKAVQLRGAPSATPVPIVPNPAGQEQEVSYLGASRARLCCNQVGRKTDG